VAAARVKDLIIASRVGWQAVTELYNSQLKGDEKLFNNWQRETDFRFRRFSLTASAQEVERGSQQLAVQQ
jgi:hypothetical protein